jgi:hypothetical protein
MVPDGAARPHLCSVPSSNLETKRGRFHRGFPDTPAALVHLVPMPVQNEDELFRALETGLFQDVLGTPESDWVEFKEQPYRLDDPRQRFELAKDVSAMANVRGGVIVIGYDTKADEVSEIEFASKLRPMPKDMFPIRRIRDIVRDLTHPSLDVQCSWYSVDADESIRGVAAISVPRLDERLKLAVVRAADMGDGRDPTERAIGVFRREQSDNRSVPAHVVQEWMTIGRTPFPELRLRSGPGHHLNDEVYPSPSEQLSDDLNLLRPERPCMTIQSAPMESLRLDWLTRATIVELYNVFLHPEQARTAGFNLDFGRDLEHLPGGGVRKVRSEAASLSLLPSGLMTLIVGYEYLGWAMGEKTRYPPHPRGAMNALALTEFTFEFCGYYARMVASAGGTTHKMVLTIHDHPIGSNVRAHLYGRWDARWGAAGSASSLTGNRGSAQIVVESRMDDPPSTAYELLVRLYREFGHTADAVSFARDGRIDPDLFGR